MFLFVDEYRAGCALAAAYASDERVRKNGNAICDVVSLRCEAKQLFGHLY